MRRTEHYVKYQIMAGLIAAVVLTGCAGTGGTVSETPAGAETTAQSATMAAEPSSEKPAVLRKDMRLTRWCWMIRSNRAHAHCRSGTGWNAPSISGWTSGGSS